MSKSVLPMFFTRRFMISTLEFRSLIHFEFILYIWCENFLISFFTCTYPIFPVLVIEQTVFFLLYILVGLFFLGCPAWLVAI